MQAKDLKVGYPYTPIAKTKYGNLDQSYHWKEAQKRGQNYLFYIGLDDGDHTFNYNNKKDPVIGDIFNPEDVIPFVIEVGDTAKIISDISGSDNKIREIGVITTIGSYDSFKVSVDGYPNRVSIWENLKSVIVIKKEAKTNDMPKFLQTQIVESRGFKVGMTVKVTHKVPKGDLDWNNNWVSSMDSFIGKKFIIEEINIDNEDSNDGDGILLNNNGTFFFFPPQCLEVVEQVIEVKINDSYTAKIYPGNRIEIGCQTINKETFLKIKDAFFQV